MSNRDLVVKTNRLNSAVQNLSLLEARIIQLAIIDARESRKGLRDNQPLTISAERYADAFGINKTHAYEMIKKSEDTLFNRRFSFIDVDGKLVKSRWLQQVKYLDGQGAIEVVFTDAVAKGIERIDGKVDFFTKYFLNNTVKFKSAYSIRLYELLAQWKNAVTTPIFELGTFRGQMGIEKGRYKSIKDFKLRVLDKALSEINEHSNLIVEYEQHKEGRKIIGFSFRIKEKPPQPSCKTFSLSERQINHFAPLLANQVSEVRDLAPAGMSMKDFENWVKNDMSDPNRQEFYRQHLSKVGFVER